MFDWKNKLKALNLGTLFEYVPHTGLECISWIDFLRQAKTILRVSTDAKAQHSKQAELYDHIAEWWMPSRKAGQLESKRWLNLPEEARLIWAQRILELYFETVLVSRKTNLDFRSERFFLPQETDLPAHWELSRFYVEFDPAFGQSLALLYQGHYECRPKDLRQALIQLGILGPEQSADEIERLLVSHFGEPSDKPHEFRYADFKKAYLELFDFIKKRQKKVPANFIWLGLALSGLYECLETLQVKVPVREIYRKTVLTADRGL